MSRHKPQAAGKDQDKFNADFFMNPIDHNHRCFYPIFIPTHTHWAIFHTLQLWRKIYFAVNRVHGWWATIPSQIENILNLSPDTGCIPSRRTWCGRMKRLLDKDGRKICSLNGLPWWLVSGCTMLLQWSRKCRRRNPRWKTKNKQRNKKE